LTLTGQVVGTPGYMAPEQALGVRMIDGRADLFALGCVLHEMLTGQRLFDGEHAMEVLGRALLHDAKTLAAVPPRLAQLVKTLIAKDPEQRSDAPRVANELAAIHTAILAGDRRALATPKQRHRRMRYALLGIGAVLAITIGYLYNRSRVADEPEDVTASASAKAPFLPLDGTYYGSEERRTVMHVPPPGGTKRSIDKIRVKIAEVEGILRIRFGGDIEHKGSDCELFARRNGMHATPLAVHCAKPIAELKFGPPRGDIDFVVAADGALGVSMTINHDVIGTAGKDGLSIHVEYEIIRILSATRMSQPPF
jgi:hypothetical protein